MGDLVDGDDGLPVEDVGNWALEKHEYLRRYIDISRSVRKKFNGPRNAGATYVDLFCGPGRAKVRGGGFVDGSCVAAWRKSVEGGAPFSKVVIADRDPERLDAAVHRLRQLDAPVVPIQGDAVTTVSRAANELDTFGLHFAFLDPYSLGALDFRIIERLSKFQRMDLLVHLSKMDLQRNLDANIAEAQTSFDRFAPGWRESVDVKQAQLGTRSDLMDFWKRKVDAHGVKASDRVCLMKSSGGQHLYWLLLLAGHKLAHRFWDAAADTGKQMNLF